MVKKYIIWIYKVSIRIRVKYDLNMFWGLRVLNMIIMLELLDKNVKYFCFKCEEVLMRKKWILWKDRWIS